MHLSSQYTYRVKSMASGALEKGEYHGNDISLEWMNMFLL